jgi:hypothetical protein
VDRVTSRPSRSSSAPRWLAVVAGPPVLFLLAVGPRYGGLLAAMWVALAGTVAYAALSGGRQQPDEYDPRGRLYGKRDR